MCTCCCAEPNPKLWRFTPIDKSASRGGISKKANARKQKAIFNIVRATHQKGPLAGKQARRQPSVPPLRT